VPHEGVLTVCCGLLIVSLIYKKFVASEEAIWYSIFNEKIRLFIMAI